MSIKRINRGGGHSYTIDGEPADGVTTVLNLGVPKPALIEWAGNTTADYAVNHWDELGALPVADRLTTLRKSRYAQRDAAARRGTEVHRYAERLISGEEVHPPEELAGHVESYVRFLDEWRIEPVLTESVVAHRALRYCGTLDVVAAMPTGELKIFDVKTARSGIYPETALQLAAYAHADVYLDADGAEQDMPVVQTAAGIWVRGDGYDVIPLDIGPRVFQTFRAVLWLARVMRDESSSWRAESQRLGESA